MTKMRKNQPHDLYAEVQQSACDKLLGSVSYPLNAFEQRQDFPGCSKLAAQGDAHFYEYTNQEIKKMLKASVAYVKDTSDNSEPSVHDEVYSFAGSLIEQAKKVIDAANSAGTDYEGPDKKEMQAIVDGGIEGLVDTLGDFGLYAWCPYLRVIVMRQPQIILSSPRIDLDGISVEVTATGEVWSKYPWWNCYRGCTKWEKVHKCRRIGTLTVSPDIKAEAHANVETKGSRVHVRGEFDKLRLDYNILDKIPLEGIANRALQNKLVFVYDAAQLIAAVPILQTKFTVDSLVLPASSSGISVGIVLRQL